MARINPGKLREKIIIEKRTVEISKGIKKETWNDYCRRKAELLDLFGAEKYSAFSVSLENSIKFKCRTSNLLEDIIGDTKNFRVVWKDRAYDLVFVDSLNGSKTEMILQVKKVS